MAHNAFFAGVGGWGFSTRIYSKQSRLSESDSGDRFTYTFQRQSSPPQALRIHLIPISGTGGKISERLHEADNCLVEGKRERFGLGGVYVDEETIYS